MNGEQLKKIHEYELRALDELDRICKKNGLTYYMVGGTLLGAVRHGGFIPWDDDMDLAMPREDYKKLVQIAEKELSPGFFLQTVYNDVGYDNRYAKLRIDNTLFVEKSSPSTLQHNGIFIDIWPLDYGRENFSGIQHLRQLVLTLISYKIRLKCNPNAPINTKKWRRKLFFALLEPFSKERLMRVVEWMMHDKGDCYVNWASHYGWKKQTMKISVYDPPVMLTFEGRECPAPRDYDYWLRRVIGNDYMQLPPVEKRETHNPVRLSFDTNGPDEVLE